MRQIPDEPSFALSPIHNTAVVEWLLSNSKHPLAASTLWAELFTLVRDDTGEIVEPSSGLAVAAGIEPEQASSIMDELLSINAIRREHQGGHTRHFLSPWVGTYIANPDVQLAARKRFRPLFK